MVLTARLVTERRGEVGCRDELRPLECGALPASVRARFINTQVRLITPNVHVSGGGTHRADCFCMLSSLRRTLSQRRQDIPARVKAARRLFASKLRARTGHVRSGRMAWRLGTLATRDASDCETLPEC